MAENKTKVNDASVDAFLHKVADEQKRDDSFTLVKLFEEVTGEPAKMWGTAIVGFGSYHYKYESGREGDSALVGFSPRAQNLTLYVALGNGVNDDLLKKLGKHTTGKGCLYIKRLSDVDMDTVKKIIANSYKTMKKQHVEQS